jgi:ArsR family transcriptional regulator
MRIYESNLDRLADVMKALADETRLRMLNLIIERECCVCEVTQALSISQTRASRNLSMLRNAGLLKQRRKGLWTYYSLDASAHPAVLVRLIGQTLKDDPIARDDLEKLLAIVKNGSECK